MDNFMKRYMPLHLAHMFLGVISLIPLFTAKLYVFKIIAGVWVFAQLYSFLYSIYYLLPITTSIPLPSDYDNQKSLYYALRRSGSSFSPMKKSHEMYNQKFENIFKNLKYKKAMQRVFENLVQRARQKKLIQEETSITPKTNLAADQTKIEIGLQSEIDTKDNLTISGKN